MLARDLMVFSCRIRSGLVIRNDQRLLLVVCIQTNLLDDSLRRRPGIMPDFTQSHLR